MITTITNKNQNLYNDLFSKADAVLNAIIQINNGTIPPEATYNENDQSYDIIIDNIKYHITANQYNELMNLEDDQDGLIEENSVKIDNLSDYFSVLKSLSSIHPLFMHLPQDENMFEIDANTRTIKKPAGNNIYAVKGDHVAEIIYFKIDRYFDIVDLGNPDIKILIQATCTDKNQEVKNYLFKCTTRDLDSEPDKVLFGWPIGSKITETAGNITFSVRFYSIGEGLEYSLGTQPTTLTIAQGLDYDVTDNELIDTSTEVYLKNYQRTGAISIPVPTFLINMKDDNTTKDIDIEKLNENNNTITVSAVAGTANLNYNLYKKPVNSADAVLMSNKVEESNVATWTLDLEEDNAGSYYCIVQAQSNRYTNQACSRYVNIFGAGEVTWKQFNETQTEYLQNQYDSYFPVTLDEEDKFVFKLEDQDNTVDIFKPEVMLEVNTNKSKKGQGELSFNIPDEIEFEDEQTSTDIEIKGINTLNGNSTETNESRTIHLCKPIPETISLTNASYNTTNDTLTITFTLTNNYYPLNSNAENYKYTLYSKSSEASYSAVPGAVNQSFSDLRTFIFTNKNNLNDEYSLECIGTFYGHIISDRYEFEFTS